MVLENKPRYLALHISHCLCPKFYFSKANELGLDQRFQIDSVCYNSSAFPYSGSLYVPYLAVPSITTFKDRNWRGIYRKAQLCSDCEMNRKWKRKHNPDYKEPGKGSVLHRPLEIPIISIWLVEKTTMVGPFCIWGELVRKHSWI